MLPFWYELLPCPWWIPENNVYYELINSFFQVKKCKQLDWLKFLRAELWIIIQVFYIFEKKSGVPAKTKVGQIAYQLVIWMRLSGQDCAVAFTQCY